MSTMRRRLLRILGITSIGHRAKLHYRLMRIFNITKTLIFHTIKQYNQKSSVEEKKRIALAKALFIKIQSL